MESHIPLIVGAGPTGLLFSLWLHKYSIPHRVVDMNPTSGMYSRAVVMHARSIETYRQLDLAEAIIAKGTVLERLVIHHDNAPKVNIALTENGAHQSKFPFVLSVTQDEQEALLEKTIIEMGGKVERGVRVENVREDLDKNFVSVTLDHNGKKENFAASYVIGCDGAHSVVRHSLDMKMEGSTHTRSLFVADIVATGSSIVPQWVNLRFSKEDFLLVFPLAHTQGRCRLIGMIPQETESSTAPITYEDIRPSVERNAANLKIQEVNWLTRYKVHHRNARTFKQGRIFLCGDAAHIHSPAGGQGMNTGLGDATNLAWKLAAVCRGAPASLLDTYEPERLPFAKKLVATTDRMYTLMTNDNFVGWFLRNIFWPYIMQFIVSVIAIGPFIFRTISQLAIEYCAGPMSLDLGDKGAPKGAVKAGNRLPWAANVSGTGEDNHAFLTSREWQAHTYGEAQGWVKKVFEARRIPVHSFAWAESMAKVGLRQDFTYLVRPDGYIGVALGPAVRRETDESKVNAYMERWGVGLKI